MIRKENYSTWYNELVVKADLAENSGIRGFIVIKPYGYAIWEKLKNKLDKMFKDTGHANAYFPLLIPKSYFELERHNAKEFAKECAIVTHYRLKTNPTNLSKLIVDPKAKLKEELIIRPTSEAIVWKTYKNWIKSYRDLPILINQWSNVVRWEMRTRIFLRTSEFLWQEGHTAHETKEEAVKETKKIINLYVDFIQNFMGIPVIQGKKTESERFAGAEETYCVEALMKDGKALQAGTSHFLGQNFSKAFDVQFVSKKGKKEYVWGTSWGVSTRLMGALIMTHSDDNGLILPPNIAPIQVIIIPVYYNQEEFLQTQLVGHNILSELQNNGISVKFDDSNHHKPGWKFSEYEKKGIPIRIVIGPKNIQNKTLELVRRDTCQKSIVNIEVVTFQVKKMLKNIQEFIFNRSKKFRDSMITYVDSYKDFKNVLYEKGGFIFAHWDGSHYEEKQIKKETNATIRCIPFNNVDEIGISMISKKQSKKRVLFARSY